MWPVVLKSFAPRQLGWRMTQRLGRSTRRPWDCRLMERVRGEPVLAYGRGSGGEGRELAWPTLHELPALVYFRSVLGGMQDHTSVCAAVGAHEI